MVFLKTKKGSQNVSCNVTCIEHEPYIQIIHFVLKKNVISVLKNISQRKLLSLFRGAQSNLGKDKAKVYLGQPNMILIFSNHSSNPIFEDFLSQQSKTNVFIVSSSMLNELYLQQQKTALKFNEFY